VTAQEKLLFKISLAVVVWAVTFVLVLLFAPRSEIKRIDCDQVEYHPDYTAEMKEQCRMMRSGKMT
jgi:hypothetical protein